MKTKIEFKIDPKVEAKNIPKIVGLGGYGMLTPEAFKIFEGKTQKELYSEVLKLHKQHKEWIIKKKRNLEKNWKKIEGDYLFELEKIMGSKPKADKIVYITSSLEYSIVDVIGRKNCFIGKSWSSILDYIVMHELTHLHYVDFLSETNLGEAGYPPLMEGVDHLILFKSPIKNLIQSKIKYEDIEFVQSNPKFMKQLEKIWEQRQNFKSFLKEAIKVQRKFEDIKIC